YGELSSINPLIITEAAAAARGEAIAEGLFVSYTGSAGQLCTKPGIAFVPDTPAGEALTAAVVERTRAAGADVVLNSRIKDAYARIGQQLLAAGGRPLAEGAAPDGDGFTVAPTILSTTAAELSSALAEE